jgi:hypothetical protein
LQDKSQTLEILIEVVIHCSGSGLNVRPPGFSSLRVEAKL